MENQDAGDARIVGHLLRKAKGTEWSQPDMKYMVMMPPPVLMLGLKLSLVFAWALFLFWYGLSFYFVLSYIGSMQLVF